MTIIYCELCGDRYKPKILSGRYCDKCRALKKRYSSWKTKHDENLIDYCKYQMAKGRDKRLCRKVIKNLEKRNEVHS